MYSRSLLLKLDKLNILTMDDAIMMQEYLESFICFIARKVLIDEHYSSIDVRYNYSRSKIDHAFSMVEQFYVVPYLREENLLSLNHILTKSIEETIHEFYMSNYSKTGSLNINSMLINCDTLLITYEFFQK